MGDRGAGPRTSEVAAEAALEAEYPPLRLFAWAALLGVAVGALGAAFRLLVHSALDARDALLASLGHGALALAASVVATAIATALAVHLVRRRAPEAAGSGVQEIEGALQDLRPLRWRRVIPVKFVGGLLALGSGLVLGREGPTIQIGGNAGAMIAERWGLPRAALRTLVAAGAGAGLAAAFNAPLAGVLLVIEEMRPEFRWSFASVQSVLIACGVADVVVRALTGQGAVISIASFPSPALEALWLFPILGALFGLLGLVFNRALVGALDLAARATVGGHAIAALVVGAAIGALAWLDPRSVGGGEGLIPVLLGGPLPALTVLGLFAVRFATSVASYGSGAPGGIFAPMLALGTLFGLAFGHVAHAIAPALAPHAGVFAVAGMGALFTATVRAPITGIALAIAAHRELRADPGAAPHLRVGDDHGGALRWEADLRRAARAGDRPRRSDHSVALAASSPKAARTRCGCATVGGAALARLLLAIDPAPVVVARARSAMHAGSSAVAWETCGWRRSGIPRAPSVWRRRSRPIRSAASPASEAARRRTEDGPNQLARGAATSPFTIFARQFQSFVIWLLIGAAIVSLPSASSRTAMRSARSSCSTRSSASSRRAAPSARCWRSRSLTAPRARVVRDGHRVDVAAARRRSRRLLVLEAGDIVAADARLIEAHLLSHQRGRPDRRERAGREGHDARARGRAARPSAPTRLHGHVGRGRGGARRGRRHGHADGARQDRGACWPRADDTTAPLQTRLDARRPSLAGRVPRDRRRRRRARARARAAAAGRVHLGGVASRSPRCPRACPPSSPIALALGVQRMARGTRSSGACRGRDAGLRDVICTDKTGTLTVGEMTVRARGGERRCASPGEGYGPNGAILCAEGADAPITGILRELLRVAAGCNDAELASATVRRSSSAIRRKARCCGRCEGRHRACGARAELPRHRTLPFDSDRKRMTVVRRRDGEPCVFINGAPEVILGAAPGSRRTRGRSRSMRIARRAIPADNDRPRRRRPARAGLRQPPADGRRRSGPRARSHRSSVWPGMYDPPRPEAKEAVASAAPPAFAS